MGANRAQGESEPIAVVGIGARFPGASDATSFWKLLRDGLDAISEVPKERFDVDALHDPTPGVPGKLSSKWGGFIQGVDLFDAAFFGISPREAARMDPQQRLALKTAWEALDDGGQLPLKLKGTPTGVFVGVHKSDYGMLSRGQGSEELDLLSEAGAARGGVAGRISYALGPSSPSA
jgi:acyl transferase domain-containing protein